MNNLLEVRDLKMHFSGVKAVDGVSFTVKEGSMLGIIGPNGSGKTTVYNALTGVYTPTAGQVVLTAQTSQVNQCMIWCIMELQEPFRISAFIEV